MASISPSKFKAELSSRLPPNWRVCTLGEIATLGSGTTPSRAKHEAYYDGGNVNWVKTGDLNDGDIFATEERITEAAVKESRCKVYPVDTVLIAMYGGFNQIGRTGILRVPAATNQALTAITVDRNVLIPRILQQWLNTQVGFWRRLAASSRKDPNITKTDIAHFPVPVPPGETQLQIELLARAFQRATGVVEHLKRLNRLRYIGIRQRLLKPGLSGWNEYRLGDLFTERIETDRVELPLLSITAERGLIRREEVDRKDSSSDDKARYKRITRGDIGYNTMRMWQGVSALSDIEGIVSPAYTVCTPGPLIDGVFAAHLFKYPPIVNLFFRYSQGLVDDTLNLKFPRFAEIRVHIPSLNEQCSIGKILSSLNREAELLDRHWELLQKQQSALMLRFLTGLAGSSSGGVHHD